jgi:hypothetical protein
MEPNNPAALQALKTALPDDRGPLLPVRHSQDLFICDVLDAIPKDDMASMEHPVFSLSTKPDNRIRRYEHKNSVIEIIPSGKGMATIHDKDILIYCISQIIAKMNQGEAPKKSLRLQAYDMLVATNRQTSGEGYRLLTDGGEETTHGFGLIEEFKICRKARDGRMLDLEITLSEWVYRSIISKNVLTLHRDYFRLRKPFERRMYELARKHCGMQDHWAIGLELLQDKCGSNSSKRAFRAAIKTVCVHDAAHSHFPDYAISIDKDVIRFQNRSSLKAKEATAWEDVDAPYLDPEAMHDAKTAAPGYDIYVLYNEWVAWWHDMGKPELKNPGGAFIGFCKKRHERTPLR